MAKRKTPKAKKEEIKITPEKARENYLNSLAKELGDLRDAITDKNKVKEELVEKYGILYKNILLEHYKTLNITFNNNDGGISFLCKTCSSRHYTNEYLGLQHKY